jgi:ketosteroid isomerase-like protein
MSQENVDAVAAGVRAYNDGDLDAMLAVLAKDAELVPVRSLVEGGSYRGHEGLRRLLAEMGEEWARFEIHPDAYREIGDCVLLLAHFELRGRASGVEASAPAAWVCECRGGKITRIRAYSDQEEALGVLGLGE